jgi:diphthamide synthase (EF-2-diphthine--ammonia ligase)
MLLHRLRTDPGREVVSLLTTVTAGYDRVSMHGVRRDVLQAQAVSTGLPLREAVIPPDAGNDDYETAFTAALADLAREHPGLRTVAFGDLFLTDVRAYREALVARVDWEATFPLWGEDTRSLSRRCVRRGFRAIVCCVDTQQLDAQYAGHEYDAALLAGLPAGVDPCGEWGEFHTCVYDSPSFAWPLALDRGERVRRGRGERFEYCDLVLRQPAEGWGRAGHGGGPDPH